MTHWAMVIDLRRCIGCRTCVMACSQVNHIQKNYWRKLIEIAEPQAPQRERYFLTMSCMHCQDPPCRDVCPTTATYQRSDGIVAIDYDKCIGCGYCIVACPYHAREIFKGEVDFEDSSNKTPQPHFGQDEAKDHGGVCTKCNFCLPRIEKGVLEKLIPGEDDAATPMCVASCSSSALHFGDLDNPKSVVSKLLKENDSIRLSEELGTAPSVFYII